MSVIDVWMQHPTLRFMQHDMFASLRRWINLQVPDEEPSIDLTIAAMDHTGVDIGLISPLARPQRRSDQQRRGRRLGRCVSRPAGRPGVGKPA
jgi:hypothetical protein